MAVGDAVRHLREQHGWTQQKLADMTRFAQGTIANIEANKHRYPRQDTLMRLAAAFDMTVDQLLQVVQNPDKNRHPAGAATASSTTQDSRLLAEMESLMVEGRTRGFTLDTEALVQQLRLTQVRTLLLAVMSLPRDDQVAIAGHSYALWERRKRKEQGSTEGI